MQPLVSLLIPIYNVEEYLRECLESARNQTLSNIEVICINDGSTDSSPEIIREYMESDPRFSMIDKPNSGYGDSMNQGLEAAQGKYVGILESDDFFELDALEKLVTAAEAEDAQVAKANFWFYWSQPEIKNDLFELVSPKMANRVVDPHKETDIFYLKPSIWSAIYRRDFLREEGIRFLETPGASYQDASFNFKVWACAERVVFLTNPILHYRQDNEASSVNSPSKVYCVCDEYAEMFRFVEGRDDKLFLKAVLEKMKFDSYMWNYERLSEPLRKEFLVRFSEEFKKDIAEGSVDLSIFDIWKIPDLNLIIKHPAVFHANKEYAGANSRLLKVVYYLRLGGPALLAEAIESRFGR